MYFNTPPWIKVTVTCIHNQKFNNLETVVVRKVLSLCKACRSASAKRSLITPKASHLQSVKLASSKSSGLGISPSKCSDSKNSSSNDVMAKVGTSKYSDLSWHI